MFKNGEEYTTYDISDFAVYKTQDVEYVENQFNQTKISLREPLKGISDNVCDKIVKKDGRW